MKSKRVIAAVLIGISLVFAGCGAKEGLTNNAKNNEKIQNQQLAAKAQEDQKSKKELTNSDLNYNISKEAMEISDKNTEIFYPQVKDYPGELLMDYMNQSLKKTADIYANEDQYSDVKVDYDIKRMDENTLSVLFAGKGKIKDYGEINIQHSINLDMKTSNEITFDNFIKDDEESKKAVINILNEKAKEKGLSGLEAEGIRIYFTEEKSVVFYYMPLDDSAKEFIELSVPEKELDGYVNTDFGEVPAS